MLQLRKDIERRQQLLSIFNQQVNLVAAHLHHLELLQQGKTAGTVNPDEIAHDAGAAEEMLAQLEADGELAQSVGNVGPTGMTAEEQALYEQLEQEAQGVGKPPADVARKPTPRPSAADEPKGRETYGIDQ